MRATRDADGSYALVYVPSGKPVELELGNLAGEHLVGHWYDPRTGLARSLGTFEKQARMSFTPPAGGPDWVLVLDDAARGFPPPGGARVYR